jgi:Family of unknown function (DUF6510)
MHTDANAIAGVLEGVFVGEATSGGRRCQACGHDHPIGEHPLYTGAGYVLRCPSCGVLAATIVERPDRYVVSLHGTWSVARAG